MASQEVTGITAEEVAHRRDAYNETDKALEVPYEERFCLAGPLRQPEDYDGPDRFCSQYAVNFGRCHYHGGRSIPHPEGLDRFARLTHSMRATRSTIFETLKDHEKVLYTTITEVWPGKYGIDFEAEPAAEYDFHALAIEIIRSERGAGYVLDEDEKGQKKVFGPDGRVHYEDVPHYLVEALQRNRRLVMQMEDNLGISRKARLKHEENTDATDLIKGFAEVGKSLLEKGSYDPSQFDPDDST
jgi:hypothetical protein